MHEAPLKIYFVLGEESGDALGADLLPALQKRAEVEKRSVDVIGLAGTKLQSLGVKSLFDIEEIAVMGFAAVAGRLPKIIKRVHETVADIIAREPDMVVLIDSPDFTHAVAKRVRKKRPNLPVVNYVCPSVWAWRQGRAKSMRSYIDHVLAILPFEPKALADLGGPPATYIGHPLARHIANLSKRSATESVERPVLLVLPGSRASELKKMLPAFGETLEILRGRGCDFDPVMPAVPRLKERLVAETANWKVKPTIVDSVDNDKTFSTAKAALATSGTVALQLSLHKVPMVSAYKLDTMARPFGWLIKSWSTLLPNLIVDRVLVPEEVNESVMPERLARRLQRLLSDTPERRMQVAGFGELIKAMKTKQPPSDLAADIIFKALT